MHLSKIGEFVALQLSSASDYCRDIDVPLFVVMPNHLYAIIAVNCSDIALACMDMNTQQRNPNPALRANPICLWH